MTENGDNGHHHHQPKEQRDEKERAIVITTIVEVVSVSTDPVPINCTDTIPSKMSAPTSLILSSDTDPKTAAQATNGQISLKVEEQGGDCSSAGREEDNEAHEPSSDDDGDGDNNKNINTNINNDHCDNGNIEIIKSNNSKYKNNNTTVRTVGIDNQINHSIPNDLSPSEVNDLERGNDLEEVQRLFEANPDAFRAWLRLRAPPELLTRVSFTNRSETSLSPRTPKRESVSSDLFQQWLAFSPTKRSRSPSVRYAIERKHLADLDEGELFMELIRDVANELDIDVLCHKILVNVGLLTHADRGSLFLVKTNQNEKYLVAKLFDVTQSTALDDAIRRAQTEEVVIPFGVGIAGIVASTKEIITTKEAYKDPRFNSEIDQRTGYKTNAMVSMPICNYEGDVIGVAQIINKIDGTKEFSEKDVEVFRRYLTFCGIGIQNAQLFETSVQEYRRNQILLNLARNIFEEQNNLECLVTKIMTEARGLLKCQRCAVFLLDLNCCEASHLERIVEKPSQPRQPLSRRQSHNVSVEDILEHQKARFTMLFELGADNQTANVSRPTVTVLLSSTMAQIAKKVAFDGLTLNIENFNEWLKEHPDIVVDEESGHIEEVLCMPIVDGSKNIIGVAQLINKNNKLQFTDSDVSILEAFAIFCGLGIHNTQMYESACKLMAKQKVALECLSYHATANQDQTLTLVQDTISSAEAYSLYSFTFNDFDLNDEDTCRATIRMFLQCNLVQQFHIPYDVLCRWILSVKKNYRPVKYHNWRHALNVTQTMFAIMKTGKMERFMQDLEIFGLLVACMCHDLDHRGTNNAFQTKTDSPLAILYSTSTMEHHHFDQCVMILNSEGNNIFQALSPDDYRKVMKIVETAILSTDLAMYFKKRNSFLELIENGEFDWQMEEKKELLCGMMMTACDVSAIAKPWEVQHKVAKLVADEFFDQGDLEKLQLNTQPIAMMDRERKDELPKMQVGFIDVICLPLYRVLAETFPWIRPLYEGTVDNRQHWQDLAEKVEMGLTWIDHDTIDKPVEEFAASTEEIEFTVTTLNCAHNDENSGPGTEKGHQISVPSKPGIFMKGIRNCMSLYNSRKSSPGNNGDSKKMEVRKKSYSKPPTSTSSSSSSGNPTSSKSTSGTGGEVKTTTDEKVRKKKSKLCLLL